MYEWQSSRGSEKILCLAIVQNMKAGANFQFLEWLVCKRTLLLLFHCLNEVLNVRVDLQAWRIRAWGQGMSQEGSRRCWDESSEAFAPRGHAGPRILSMLRRSCTRTWLGVWAQRSGCTGQGAFYPNQCWPSWGLKKSIEVQIKKTSIAIILAKKS